MVRRLAWCGVWLWVLVVSAQGAPVDKSADKAQDDYYELYKVLIDTMDQVERNYVKEVDRRELIEAAVRGVLEKLDPYSSYISPDEIDRFRANVESEFGGIGIQVSVDGGQLKVISPLVGTPAYRAGLMAGDRIVEIDGKPCDGLTIDEAVRRLKGPENTSVALTVIHAGRATKETITVTRERIRVDTVLGDRRKDDDSWDFMLKPDAGIAYIRLTGFSRETAKDLRKAMEQLEKENLRGLIVDLRFNPGGLLTSAIDVSDLFISSGRIVSTQGRATPERIWDARRKGTFEGFPMVLLVNRYSASASEIVAACLQDHQRAIVLGERSWGKGSVQNVIELENGSAALKLTTAAYRRPNGKNIHRFDDAKDEDEWGVMPDKGFEIKLGDSEMIALVQERRRRDIVAPKEPASKPDAETVAESGSEKETPAAKPDERSQAKPNGEAKPHAEPKMPDATSDKPAADAKVEAIVDRQLEAAVKHLTGELAKAK
jgi:carboxyl-terminal processing protease